MEAGGGDGGVGPAGGGEDGVLVSVFSFVLCFLLPVPVSACRMEAYLSKSTYTPCVHVRLGVVD